MESKRLNGLLKVYRVGWSSKLEESGESQGMGVTQEGTERFQGRVESQAVAGAHKPVTEPISTKLRSRTQQLPGQVNMGLAGGQDRKLWQQERDLRAPGQVWPCRTGRQGNDTAQGPRGREISRDQVSWA